jgi:hypothetical protein
VSIRLAPATYAAAKYAVENWHYSQRMPAGKLVRIGVWEDGAYIGVVIFGRGGSSNLGKQHGLPQTEICELVRIALTDHVAPVTQIVAEALRFLKRTSPGIRLVVSYADPAQGHVGKIYQAGGWIFTGVTAPMPMYRDKRGRLVHNRVVSPSGYRRQFGQMKPVMRIDEAVRVDTPGKFRYLMPLDKGMRRQMLKRQRPYPVAASRGQGVHGDALDVPSREPGSSPGDRSSESLTDADT